MKYFLNAFAGIAGGLIIGMLIHMLYGMATADYGQPGVNPTYWPFLISSITIFLLALTAHRPAAAWRRVLVCLSLVLFAFPVFGFFMATGLAAGSEDVGGQIAGAVVGGTIATIASSFAFVFGVIVLIVGLLIGRDNRVRVIQE